MSVSWRIVTVSLWILATFAAAAKDVSTEHIRDDRSYGSDETSLHLPTSTDTVFATANSTEVTAQTGSTASLSCIVRNIGDGVVSWIRRSDYHLLTVGLTTYSSDKRFQVLTNRQTQDWSLQIRGTVQQDEGIYECQVSTHPAQSIFIHLKVVEAYAKITGSPDKYIKSGSTLKLICEIYQSTEPPTYVFWYHNSRMINYDVERGVTVKSDKDRWVIVIGNAQKSDSGNYSCTPSNARGASINVHILNGEKPAAMQHGSRAMASTYYVPGSTLSICCVIGVFFYTMVASNVGVALNDAR